MSKHNLAYLLLILTTIFWSGNFIVGKLASFHEIPPFSLNFYRWFFAGIILLPFTFKELIRSKEYIYDNIGLFIVLGITSITIFNSVVYYSLYHTQVINGLLMISTIPVWIIFISLKTSFCIMYFCKLHIYKITNFQFSTFPNLSN